jgi:hypothetical protein
MTLANPLRAIALSAVCLCLAAACTATRATKVARRVNGVTAVDNNLKMKGATRAPRPTRSKSIRGMPSCCWQAMSITQRRGLPLAHSLQM